MVDFKLNSVNNRKKLECSQIYKLLQIISTRFFLILEFFLFEILKFSENDLRVFLSHFWLIKNDALIKSFNFGQSCDLKPKI